MFRANCIVQSAIPAMVLGVSMLASTTASAADRPRTNYQNMGANCHAAKGGHHATSSPRHLLPAPLVRMPVSRIQLRT